MRTVIAILAFTGAVWAQQSTLDRSKIPPPGAPPVWEVPACTKSTLSNGADFIVCEKHHLPVLSFTITFLGGADQFEAAGKRGVAGLTASMMSEGTRARDGEAQSKALRFLGTRVDVGMERESGSLRFQSTTGKFAQTLEILADMLVSPTFPAAALERVRSEQLVALARAKSEGTPIADRVFSRLLYGAAHPYGQQPTDDTVKAITRDDVIGFHKAYFQPGRALVTVVGDVDTATVKTMSDKALASWPRGGKKPAFAYPNLPMRRPTTIYLVDKPGAAQSTFAIGNPGPPVSTSDYYALQVMNTILGHLYQSRLMANIREQKGWSYDVRSDFGFGRGPGAFRAGGDIASANSGPALVEFMRELRGMAGARPATDEELTTAKAALIQRLPDQFARVDDINDAITAIWKQGLPDDYYQQYGRRVSAVTKDDVTRVAKQYIDVDHVTIVIVGDRASIEGPLKATGIGPLTVVDFDGNPAR